mgnify:CR=1 FL=1
MNVCLSSLVQFNGPEHAGNYSNIWGLRRQQKQGTDHPYQVPGTTVPGIILYHFLKKKEERDMST